MKTSLVLIASLTFPTLVYASGPQVILSPVDHVFVPQGFDNNDNVEIIVTGKFPNPCYIKNKVEVDVAAEKIFITVTALKRDEGNTELCAAMAVPFKEDITIGNLQGGSYEVIVNEKSRHEKREKLNVAVSSSNSVDDYLYPIVEYVDLGFTGGVSGSAFLIAKAPSDCVVFDKVEYISNKKDTISILPIMKKITTTCNEKKTRIMIPIKFNLSSISNKEVLLFVRSIEGKSVNAIISK